MNAAAAIAAREFLAHYRTASGWLIAALFLLLTGAVFTANTLVPGEPASLRYFFSPAAWLLVVIAPAISMRSFAEEARTGTIEPLLTGPATDPEVVLGKHAGSVAFLLSLFLPSLLFPLLLAWAADAPLDLGPIITGYLGLALVGSTYLALGLLVSALTDSQTLAFLAAFLLLTGYLIVTGPTAGQLPAPFDRMAAAAAVQPRLADFAKGVLDLGSLVAFGAIQCALLAGSWAAIDARRWR
ncbi:MAG: ABC transporter permease subunit [Planctomycetota bacterium]